MFCSCLANDVGFIFLSHNTIICWWLHIAQERRMGNLKPKLNSQKTSGSSTTFTLRMYVMRIWYQLLPDFCLLRVNLPMLSTTGGYCKEFPMKPPCWSIFLMACPQEEHHEALHSMLGISFRTLKYAAFLTVLVNNLQSHKTRVKLLKAP